MKNKNNNTHDNWQTPKHILDQIEKEFGKFFDPCPINADFNGLEIEWKSVNFINPPWSIKLKTAFVKKAIEESKKGKVCIVLIPVSKAQNFSMKIFCQMLMKLDLLRGGLILLDLTTRVKMERNFNLVKMIVWLLFLERHDLKLKQILKRICR